MSSLPSQARGAASRTADSTWLEHLTRGGLVGYGIIHLLFAWLILQIAFDGSSTDGDQSGALHKLAEEPFGTFAGIAIAVIGAGLVIYGVRKRFEKHLKTSQMTAQMRRISLRLGVTGYVAKGAAYGIAGVLFLVAAVKYDPDKARGLDATLSGLSQQAYGPWLLALTALGIAAYGLFSIVQSRYRKV
jgi:hypothetical protein